MKVLSVFAALLALCSTPLIAQCLGQDLRPTLTPAEAGPLRARTQADPFAVGNHWQATKGDTVLHLIGTVHLDDPRLNPVTARLAPLIERADRLWLEATAQEEQQLKRAVVDRPDLLFLTTGPTLPELLSDSAWQDVANAAQARGVPAFMAAKFQPWYLSVTLSMPACATADIQSGGRGLDKRLMALAEAEDVPQFALEPYDTLFRLMARAPLAKQLDFLSLGVPPDAVVEDALATLMASYFEERTLEVLEMSRIVAKRHIDISGAAFDVLFDEMMGGLLAERNRAWLDILRDAPAGLSVVAVGAGHLSGPDGLLILLQDAGFTLTRQPF